MEQKPELLKRFKKADFEERTDLFLYHRNMRNEFQKIDENDAAGEAMKAHHSIINFFGEDVKTTERRKTMDEHVKSLIAIGASVTANCQSCIEYHFSKALALGIDKTDIEQAVHIAKEVRKGAANGLDKHAFNLIQKESNVSPSKNSTCNCCL